jgi:hypothetical protein
MRFLTSVTGELSIGGDAGGVTGLVNFTPPGLGDCICLIGIWMGAVRSMSVPGLGSTGVDFSVVAGCDPCEPREGGGVVVFLGKTAVAIVYQWVRFPNRRQFRCEEM